MPQFSRNQIQAALVCYAAFLLYATLWPFDFHFVQGLAAARKISWIPFFDPTGGPDRKDAAMNLLVFLPFGALSFLYNSTSAKRRLPVLIATVLGGSVSLFVEVAQIWLPSRTTSVSDLLMNATGALLGALIARSVQRTVQSDPEILRRFLRRTPMAIATIAYALALLASTMGTFDLLLVKGVLRTRAGAFFESPLLGDHFDRDTTAWMILSFGFLSYLAADWFTGSSRTRGRPFRHAVAFATCSFYVVALEVLQILFRSRYPLRSHALFGILGVVYGTAWHVIIRPSIVFQLFLLHYLVLLFLAFPSPFNSSTVGFHFDLRGLIPFYFYLQNISLPMFYLACKPFVLHLPLGLMIQRWFAGPSLPFFGKEVLVSVCLQSIIEIGKGFLASSSPDPWNVLLAALGAYAGAGISRRLFSLRQANCLISPSQKPEDSR
ncbi:MAG: VanZ family protein [Deltaproteobacteria bacterium]|nr:MAG: VanZ family protein [Deltaproteobacteria bacterium]